MLIWGFPGGSDSEQSACNAGDLCSIPGLGRSPGEGNGYPRQYSCLENSMGQILGTVSVPDRSQWLVPPGMALLFPPLVRPDQEKLSPWVTDKCRPPSQICFCPNLLPTPIFGIKDCSLKSGHTPLRGPFCSGKGIPDSLVGCWAWLVRLHAWEQAW